MTPRDCWPLWRAWKRSSAFMPWTRDLLRSTRSERRQAMPRCEHDPKPGAKFRDDRGETWLICQRDRPESPLMCANVDTGVLCMFMPGSTIHVAEWIDVKLSAVLRWLGDVIPNAPTVSCGRCAKRYYLGHVQCPFCGYPET